MHAGDCIPLALHATPDACVKKRSWKILSNFIPLFIYFRHMDDNTNEKQSPKITRIPAGDIICYEVYEHELDQIANGSQNQILLNIAIGLISIAFTLLTTLIKFPHPSSTEVYLFFLTLCIVAFIVGFILMALWVKNRKPKSDILNTIKSRSKPSPPKESSE